MKKILLLPFLIFLLSFVANAQLSVFSDSYGAGATFVDFGGSINAVTIDNTVAHSGTSSIKAVVPSSSYTGGAFKAAANQNLSSYNAVSFWVKADASKTLNVSGISNNGTVAVFQAEYLNLPVSTTWTKYTIPIPAASKLTAEDGLFHFAEGSDEGAYTLWFDDIQYENSPAVGAYSPAIASQTINALIGGTFGVGGQTLSVLVNGVPQNIAVNLACFSFMSSNPAVATIAANGTGNAVGAGTATITATLNGVAATGAVTVNVTGVTTPATAAPTPTHPAANVISLFSDAYTSVPNTNWNPNWGQSTAVADISIAGNETKRYNNLNYQGIEFQTAINASTMQFLHVDVWTPNCTAFEVFLINPGPIEKGVTVNPTLSGWNSFDIPLSSYTPTVALNNIFQIKLVGTPFGTSQVYMDNLYFYNTAAATAPTVAAPTPTRLPANVISLFSNAYTDVAGTNWNPNWGQSTVVADVMIAGNDTKKYTTLNYQGIEFTPAVDASTMQFVHFDLWTPNATAFEFFLINPGPVEKAVTVNPTAGTWNSYDFPLSAFTPTINLSNIFQIKLVGTPFGTSTVYLDNLYFYKNPVAAPTEPTTAAPTPTRLPAYVKSLFSGAYTDVAGTDWFPNWGQSTVVTDVTIAGDIAKKYATLNYQGVQFNPAIDASNMEFLHLDLWTPNCTAFEVFLINPGPIEKAFTITPTLSGWNSIDIPLTAYTPTINLGNIIQFKLVGTPFGTSTVWLDNIYFYRNPALVPTAAAPTPTRLPAYVKSLFSDAYTNVAGTDWNPNWGQSTVVTDVTVGGNAAKKYATLNYQGVQFNPALDATGMEFLHFDLWTPDCTAFDMFLINPGPVEKAVTVNPTLSGWNSFDIPLTSYNTIALNNIIQFKLVGTPFGSSTVWLDNIYFYKNPPTAPLAAASTPPARPAPNVISLFSDAYTNVPNIDWFPNWGQSTVVADISISGNTTKKYSNLNYQGVQFAAPINASAMEKLHFDLWTGDCNAFDVFLINTTPATVEQKVTVTPTAFGWNSYDIPLSSYNTINLANIGQFKLVGSPAGSTVFLDNIYFYNTPAMSVSTNTLSIAAPANSTKTFNITSNTNWTVTSNQSWLSINTASGTGNATITLTAQENFSVNDTKTATVTISVPGLADQIVTVTQETAAPVLTLNLSTLTIAAPANSTKPFEISSNTNWNITVDQTWLSFDKTSGSGNYGILAKAEANTAIVTRTATITVTANNVASQTILVTQEAALPTINVSSSNVNIAALANSTQTVDITSNTNWTTKSNGAWLSLNKASGMANETLTLTAQENTTTQTRSTTVVISATSAADQTINVTQAAGAAVLVVSAATLTVASPANSTKSFDVTSNTDWTITSNETWLALDKTNGTANETVTITAQANPNPTIRTATLTVSAAGAADKTIIVTQDAAGAILMINPSILTLAAAANSSKTFDITSNLNWTVTSSETWLAVGTASGSNNGTVTLTAQENLSTKTRTATVTISGNGVGNQIIMVTQEGAKAVLTISTNDLSIASLANSTNDFDIKSNTVWSASTTQAWLKLSLTNGTDDAKITITADANPNVTTRKAFIIITATDVADQTINVTQEAAAAVLSVTPNDLTVGAADNSMVSFNVNSNTNWNVSSNQAWLKSNGSGGFGNNLITLTAAENTSSTSRVAKITISAKGAADQIVTVTQEAGKAVLTVSVTALTIAAPANSTKPFDITSNTGWTVTSNETWLAINTASGNGNGTIILTAQANTTGAVRTATVTIKGNGTTDKTITVTQDFISKANDLLNTIAFSLYPNPVENDLTIQVKDATIAIQTINIFDLNGKKLLQFEGFEGQKNIDVSSLPQGVYLIQLMDKKSQSFSNQKFIKI